MVGPKERSTLPLGQAKKIGMVLAKYRTLMGFFLATERREAPVLTIF
jgi:hypothetical protein